MVGEGESGMRIAQQENERANMLGGGCCLVDFIFRQRGQVRGLHFRHHQDNIVIIGISHYSTNIINTTISISSNTKIRVCFVELA